MNRVCYALHVLLCGVPEPEVREIEKRVEVSPWMEDGSLYRVSMRRYLGVYYGEPKTWNGTYHKTCAEAFAAVPIAEQNICTVEPVPVIKLGERYFSAGAEIKGIGLPKPDLKNGPKKKAVKIKGRS